MTKQNKEFYTVEEIADKLQLHWQTILDYIRNGKLKAVKLGKGYRIPIESFDEFVKNGIADATISSISSSTKYASMPENPKHTRYRSVLVLPVGISKKIIPIGPENDQVIQDIIKRNANVLDPKPDIDGLVDDRMLEYDGREVYFRLTEEGIVFFRISLTEPEKQVYISQLLHIVFNALKISHDVYKKFDINPEVLVKFRMENIKDNILRTGSSTGRSLSVEDKSLNESVEVNIGPVELNTNAIEDLTVNIVLTILRGFGNNRLLADTLKDFLKELKSDRG